MYMDNLFVSVHTFQVMLQMKTYGCGTTRAHRGMPPDLEKSQLKLKNNNTLEEPGDFAFRQGGGRSGVFTAFAWLDSGEACAMSTRHDGVSGLSSAESRGCGGASSESLLTRSWTTTAT